MPCGGRRRWVHFTFTRNIARIILCNQIMT
jgi:hypothetical protein